MDGSEAMAAVFGAIERLRGKAIDSLPGAIGLDPRGKGYLSGAARRSIELSLGEKQFGALLKKASAEMRVLTGKRRPDGLFFKENLPFPAFSFKEIALIPWEDSDLRKTLAATNFILVLLDPEDKCIGSVLPLKMDEETLEGKVREAYLRTQSVLLSGDIVREAKEGRHLSNFPGEAEKEGNPVHVRPHGRDSRDRDLLPVPDRLTGLKDYPRQAFWISRWYMDSLLKGERNG